MQITLSGRLHSMNIWKKDSAGSRESSGTNTQRCCEDERCGTETVVPVSPGHGSYLIAGLEHVSLMPRLYPRQMLPGLRWKSNGTETAGKKVVLQHFIRILNPLRRPLIKPSREIHTAPCLAVGYKALPPIITRPGRRSHGSLIRKRSRKKRSNLYMELRITPRRQVHLLQEVLHTTSLDQPKLHLFPLPKAWLLRNTSMILFR